MTNARKQLEQNIAAYEANERELVREHCGKIALFHNGELIALYDDNITAFEKGVADYGEGEFSIKEIGAPPINLGIFSTALGPSS